jgi:hypothetical protein
MIRIQEGKNDPKIEIEVINQRYRHLQDDLHKLLKDKSMKKKPVSKSTLKEKKRREQFLKDLQFLREATAHPEYRKDPLKTISTHLQNSLQANSCKTDRLI